MEPQVARLTDAKYLVRRPIQKLFHDAFDKSPIFPKGFEGMVEDIVRLIEHPLAIVLIGFEDNIPKALCIITLPETKLVPHPQIFHFYNGGSLAMRKKLTKATVEVIRQAGYIKFWTINATGRPDSVWARAYRMAGKARPIGGLIEFDINTKAS